MENYKNRIYSKNNNSDHSLELSDVEDENFDNRLNTKNLNKKGNENILNIKGQRKNNYSCDNQEFSSEFSIEKVC